MAKSELGGVWRTINGNRVFIKEGQSVAEAIEEDKKKKGKTETKETENKPEEQKKTIDKNDKTDEINEKSKEKVIEAEKTTDEDKRYNTNYEKRPESDDARETAKDNRQTEKIEKGKDDFDPVEFEKWRVENDPEFEMSDDTARYIYEIDKETGSRGGSNNKFTSEELKEKYGTDDVELINAGKEAQDRVSKKEELWEKQEDGSFKANKDAMKADYEARHKKYDDKIKQFAEDRENMTNSDWEASIMAYEKQNADGTYKTMDQIMEDVNNYKGKEPKYFHEGKKDIEEEFKQIYAEEGLEYGLRDSNVEYLSKKYDIPKTQVKEFMNDTAKKFDEENARKNYYTKENLGEPSNYKKGDKVKVQDEYTGKFDTDYTVVREATAKEKEGVVNSNLKAYVLQDKDGNEIIKADTRLKQEDPFTKFKNEKITKQHEIDKAAEYKELSTGLAKRSQDYINRAASAKSKNDLMDIASDIHNDIDMNDDVYYAIMKDINSDISLRDASKNLQNYVKEHNTVAQNQFIKDYDIKPKKSTNEIMNEKIRNGANKEKKTASASISNNLSRAAYNKYLKEHPGSKITFEDFKKKNK